MLTVGHRAIHTTGTKHLSTNCTVNRENNAVLETFLRLSSSQEIFPHVDGLFDLISKLC